MRLRRLAHVNIHLRVHAGLYVKLSFGRVGEVLQVPRLGVGSLSRARQGGTRSVFSTPNKLSCDRHKGGRWRESGSVGQAL